MNPFVKSRFQDGIGTITLARPDKRNALKREFIVQLSAAVETLAARTELRVLVFEAEGTVFCAGMDLGEMQMRAQSDSGEQDWQRDSEVYAELLLRIFQLSVPTVVRLQGPALAGGVGLILACDFIVAAENTFVMLPEPMRGITAAMVTPFLVFRAGAGVASQLLLSGQRMTAERCERLGLFFQTVADNELDQAVSSLANSIVTGSRSALAITKDHIHNCAAAQLKAQLQASIGVSAKARETADAREGLAAFLEKREPSWFPVNR